MAQRKGKKLLAVYLDENEYEKFRGITQKIRVSMADYIKDIVFEFNKQFEPLLEVKDPFDIPRILKNNLDAINRDAAADLREVKKIVTSKYKNIKAGGDNDGK